MKIAIPTRAHVVDDHFGHCEYYTIFTVNEEKIITETETLAAPQGCGCKSNIASVLKEQGVTVMLAGSMGDGALKVLNNQGIKVFRGCKGDVRTLVESYLKGFVLDSGIGCHHHEGEEHKCSL
ncbi:NifB/NifX family molybdenum-iron cluster-binding protein [uncultured Sanguibacteroides sp.]|uniref:NifB/NifX family molybdenum-iron cluster-binding protein n=1 Tax=uncultured Sanguibacteroides sp. TaxID=1635151 RepID=UPI0025F5B0C5|nr:NifB/NifX family molybdenum-iron cluster-binding protein [uncultured Sanguibacteroides sp.]